MKAILTFIVQFFTESQDTYSIKVPALLLVLMVLLIALWICMVITKKNRLYIKPKEKDNIFDLHKENEVA